MSQKKAVNSFRADVIRDEDGIAVGLYIPDKTVQQLMASPRYHSVKVDDIEYPCIFMGNSDNLTPLVQLLDGRWASWETKPAMKQHALNVTAQTLSAQRISN